MQIGSQLRAPQGWNVLQKDIEYYLLDNNSCRDRTLLIYFECVPQPKVHMVPMRRDKFEEGLTSNMIVLADVQRTLPPWLSEYEGKNLAKIDGERRRFKRRHSMRVSSREAIISPLVKNREVIFLADDPVLEINRYARQCPVKQNETRFRLWYFTYLLFNDEWALHPPFHRIGKWSRQDLFPGKKFGRKNIAHGEFYGHAMTHETIKTIEESYIELRKQGRTLHSIYIEAMDKHFGCKTKKIRRAQGEWVQYFHPKGDAFPNLWQYRYWILQKFGLEAVQRARFGDKHVREKIAASEGKFSESTANLMEDMEADGYYTSDHPSGMIEGSVLPKLCVVRGICTTSGFLGGIGFSVGKEKSTAYRLMLFCMAIDKQKFCRLFGIEIHPDDWPCFGESGAYAYDRGPGSTEDLIKELEDRFPIRNMAPTGAGQSKATVESSHPRERHIEESPSFVQSDLNTVEMAQREIIRLLEDNQSSAASDRRTPEMIAAGIVPSPHGIWTYLDKRGRTDLHPITFEKAVRKYLTPVKFTVRVDGVYYHEHRFDSDELRSSGILDKVATSQRIHIKGFFYDLAVRYAWVEVNGELIEVEARLPIRDDESQLFMSLEELDQLYEHDRMTQSMFREHKNAVQTEKRQQFKDLTGKSWDAGTKRGGRAKTKSKVSQREQNEIKKYATAGGGK